MGVEAVVPEGGELDEARLAETIREVGIPPRPLILEKIATEMRKEYPEFRVLAQHISADVSISGSLLKLVNSPFYGFRQRARSVQDALTMLGLNTVSSALAGIVLRNLLPTPPRLERFWDASARIAQVSAWLVQELGAVHGLRAADAYTFSLFRDCGIPIMLRKYPDYFDTLRLANAEGAQRFTDIEEAHHPTNHAVVGCLLSQSWWLPESTSEAIRHHHDFVSLRAGGGAFDPVARRLICIAQLADHLVETTTGRNHSCEWAKMGEACLQLLDIDPARLEALEAAAVEAVTAAGAQA